MCGSCCDPVLFSRANHAAMTKWTTKALQGVPDPSTDEGWAHWEHDEAWKGHRELAIHRFRLGSNHRRNAEFITAHWHPVDDESCACDQFSRETRLCMAQDSKPPVCVGYPWYGEAPEVRGASGMPAQCSYLADLPPAERPEGSRPLIPITPLR